MIIKEKAILFIEFEMKLDTIVSAKELGYKTVLCTSKREPGQESVFDDVFEVDLKSIEDVDNIILEIKKRYKVRGVISNYEKYVVQRSYFAECFGLPSTSVYSACCSRNKVMQRHALGFMKENIPYRIVRTDSEAIRALKRFKNDIFLKTIAGIRSENIFHIQSEEELMEALNVIKDHKMDISEDLFTNFSYFNFLFHYPDPKKTFLIEKAIKGSQLGVVSFANSHSVAHAPSVLDIYSAKDIGINDSYLAFRILPSKKPANVIKEAHEITKTAIKVLGIQCSAVHTEIILPEKGPMRIIELASRMGGYREIMYKESFDLDISKLTVYSALNKKLQVNKKFKNYVSLVSIFPRKDGKYGGYISPELDNDKSISNFKENYNIGDMIGSAKNGFRSVITFLISGKTYEEVYKKSMFYQTNLEIVVK